MRYCGRRREHTSAYSEDSRLLPVGKNKKVIGLMKDELAGKIMTESVSLRAKMYAYRKLDEGEDKRCKGTKKCVVAETFYACLKAKGYAGNRGCLSTGNTKFIR